MKKETLYEMIGYADDDLLTRSEQHIVRRIGKAARFGGRRLLPWAAAAAVFFTSAITVAAVILYHQRVEEVTEPLRQRVIVPAEGDETERYDWEHDGPGLLFSWEGFDTGTERYQPEFQVGYLPGIGTEDDTKHWHSRIIRDKRNEDLFRIEILYPTDQVRGILAGECEIVMEEQWGALQVTGVHVEHPAGVHTNGVGYDGGTGGIPEENHVFLFDTKNGYVIQMAGTQPMEEIIRTARSMKIRMTDKVFDPYEGMSEEMRRYEEENDEIQYGYINLARG
ncbi:MAG: hypothetical protein IJP92_04645 [Lachnospiraceae bacterium]|nr:hypothetical protein [Lachnospiraceae bacterium]